MMYKLLQDRCSEIKIEGKKDTGVLKVTEAYDLIVRYAKAARNEGLLALEEMAETLNREDSAEAFFYTQISLIVDGTDPKLVNDIGINNLISSDIHSYEGLIALMYLRGSIMIQCGDNPHIIEQMLQSLLPIFIRKVIEERSDKEEILEEIEKAENRIEKLCADGKEIDETNHSLINQTAISMVNLTDIGVQRLLKEVCSSDITYMLIGLPGIARRRVFDNLSERIRDMISADMEYLGPVRLRDVEDACAAVMKKLVRHADYGEIHFDNTALKVVLDIYDKAEQKNKELRDSYRDVKRLIDEIYRR